MAAEPRIVQAVRAQRVALLAREAAQMTEMAQVWATVEASLQAEMDALALQIDAMRKAGEIVNPGKVYRMERYTRLLFQVRGETGKYADYAAQRVATGQAEASWIAQQEAANTLALQGARVSPALTQLAPQTVEGMVGMMGDGTPLRTYLEGVYGDSAQGMSKYLTRAVAQGLNPNQTAREMRKGLRLGLDRALTIARTEQMRVYRETSRLAYQQSGVVQGYKRLAAKQARTCLGCLVADGRIYPLAESFEDHPRGRCTLVPIVEGVDAPEWETGSAWLAKQPEETQLQIMGPTRHALWQQNQVPLKQMATHTHDPVWGGAWVPTPVKDLFVEDVQAVAIAAK